MGSALADSSWTTWPSEREIFKIILTARPQNSIPTALWSSSYFLFHRYAVISSHARLQRNRINVRNVAA